MNPTLASLATTLASPPPWLSSYAPLARQVIALASDRSVVAALNAVRDANNSLVRFAEHSALPIGEPYESFIARTACVPTRDNAHDVFNALVWLSFPHTKRRLNALQAAYLSQHGAAGPRGPLRDALTVFDENAALLRAPEVLIDALRRRDWRTLFVEQRAHWKSAQLVLFGHALMEKLLNPRKAITAHVWIVDDFRDEAVASSLDAQALTTRLFLPLPVLGVPGWWIENETPGFYDDADAFRPPR